MILRRICAGLLIFTLLTVFLVLELSFDYYSDDSSSSVPFTRHGILMMVNVSRSSTNGSSLNKGLLSRSINTSDNANNSSNSVIIRSTGNALGLHRLRDRFLAIQKNKSVDTKLSRLKSVDNFPRIIIVGFAKTGTKALYEALKLHPQLSGPLKELRYFTEHYSDNLQDYLDKFSHAPSNGSNIEKSPDYILSLQAAHRLKQACLSLRLDPSILKFVVMVRNPVARTVSDFLELKSWALMNHNNDFSPKFSEHVIDKDGGIATRSKIVNSSCYLFHLKRWMTVFERKQFCYVNGDSFVHDPFTEIKKLESCLGLEPFYQTSNFVFNIRKGFYCFKGSASKVICMSKSKGRTHPFVEKDLVTRLKQFFAPWNKDLYNFINRTDFNWELSEDY